MRSPSRIAQAALALLVLAAVAGGAGAWLRGREASLRLAALDREVAALRERVGEEAAGRAALALEVERLREALAAATTAGAPAAGGAEPQPAARGAALPDEAAPVAASDPPPDSGPAHDSMPRSAVPSFSTERLLAAGFRREDVERFRTRLDEIELERLYLRDRAAREGWLDTPRFREESRALGDAYLGLRDEFDEQLYDWVLYSTGHPNRVAVTEVISGSAGESVGLRSGDVIVRYDERLVLSPIELRDATTTGREGELVAVEVQRDGEGAPLRLFVPRGPIGVRLSPTSIEPAPAG